MINKWLEPVFEEELETTESLKRYSANFRKECINQSNKEETEKIITNNKRGKDVKEC